MQYLKTSLKGIYVAFDETNKTAVVIDKSEKLSESEEKLQANKTTIAELTREKVVVDSKYPSIVQFVLANYNLQKDSLISQLQTQSKEIDTLVTDLSKI